MCIYARKEFKVLHFQHDRAIFSRVVGCPVIIQRPQTKSFFLLMIEWKINSPIYQVSRLCTLTQVTNMRYLTAEF